jgi:hypothetical protein
MENKYIILYGNPVDGLSFEGPFDSFDDAEAHTLEHDNDWWIVDLIEPDHDTRLVEVTVFERPENANP